MFRKILRSFLYIVLATVILISIVGFLITKYYGDEIKEYSIQQVNERLQTKVSVGNIEISFFSKFPFLSVVFTDVIANSGEGFDRNRFLPLTPVDTLFSAKKIYLQFNVFELLTGNYKIRRILASGGELNMLIDHSGNVNYMIFKKSQATNKKNGKSKKFELDGVKLQDFKLKIINIAKELYVSAEIHDVLFKGRFVSGTYDIASMASFRLIDVTRDSVNYAGNSDVSVRMVLNVKDSTAFIQKGKGELVYNSLKMDISGNFGLGKESDMDVSLNGRNFDLRSLFFSLPRFTRDKLPFEIFGRGDIALKVHGRFSRIQVPSINARYNLNVNRLKFKNKVFQNIDVEGSFSNGRLQNPYSTIINIEHFTIRDYQSELMGSLKLWNLKEPAFKISLQGAFDASMIPEFSETGKITDFKGSLKPDLNIEAKLKSFENFNTEQILSGGLTGSLELLDFGFRYNDKFVFSGIGGNIRFSGDTWFPELEVHTTKGISRASLQLDNVLDYFSERKGSLWLSGSSSIGFLDLSPFFIPNREQGGRVTSEDGFIFPERLYMRLDLDIEHLEAGKFSADKIKTYLQYRPGSLTFSPFSMETMTGKINGNGSLSQDINNKIIIESDADIYSFNINQLFKTFNNFQQSFIIDENLKGFISGSVNFSISLDNSFNAIWPELETNADIVIRSGELINFEPILKLSRFIEVKELEHIFFSTIENKIIIKNSKVIIPQMDINSSAFNIGVAGTHRFDNYFEYKLKVSLSEILTKKAGAKKENIEFGVIEPDGRRTNLYLNLAGTPDNFKIKYDTKEAINKIKQDLQEEKKTLKTILNEEFGWFKKDSSKIDVYKNEDQKFIIDWEEDDSLKPKPKPKSGQKRDEPTKNKEKIEFEWDEDMH